MEEKNRQQKQTLQYQRSEDIDALSQGRCSSFDYFSATASPTDQTLLNTERDDLTRKENEIPTTPLHGILENKIIKNKKRKKKEGLQQHLRHELTYVDKLLQRMVALEFDLRGKLKKRKRHLMLMMKFQSENFFKVLHMSCWMGEKVKDMNSVSFSDFTNCKNFRNLIKYLKIVKNSGKVFTICKINIKFRKSFTICKINIKFRKSFTICKINIKFRKSFYNL
uniref:Uncharacterized protein n=1 Tax=Meloidogyne enterolobii TaxID=390850 RepID=A0A6V7YED5_MELEN|nr:unnamed protein product [Meloidogyne enterolobii]